MARGRAVLCAIALGVLTPLTALAQTTGQITGIVRSELGEPLAGVQVIVDGTSLMATTADNGRYTLLNVPVGSRVIRAVTVGYAAGEQTVQVVANSPTVVDFALPLRAVSLDQIVVVGYGTQQRQQVTGAVASVGSEQFVKGPARDAVALIAGKIAGLAVVQPSGDPRSGSEIQLRGRTTMQGPTSPLILVDGTPGDLESVAPEDIDEITVLKDGSAAAIYGSRASNGVILITTKKYEGRATFRYDGFISQSRIANAPEFLTADDYRRLIADGFQTTAGEQFEDLGFNTNWQDEILRNPMSQRHNLTFAGGALNTNYTASLNYEANEGILKRSDNNETTARANIRHEMLDGKLAAEANIVSRTEKNFTGPNFGYVWRQALIRNPTDRVLDDTGTWQERSGYFYINPMGLIEEESGEQERRTTRLHGSLAIQPIDILRISVLGGATRSNYLAGDATTLAHYDNVVGNNGGRATRNTSSSVDRIMEITSTLADRIGGHTFTLLGGYSYQDFVDEGFSAVNTRFPTDLFGWNSLQRGSGISGGEVSNPISSGKDDYKLIGFFGRLNYDWNNRYQLMASLRYEGNSRFGSAHQWGTFPAISAGWRVSEESFMQGLDFVSDLRLRGGYGITGIAPNSSYLSLTSYSYSNSRFLYNGGWVQTLAPARNPNPDLRWEQKDEVNVGLNFSLFDYRLSGALDVYKRETKDMLYNYSVPVPPYLTSNILANVGTMKNSGVEVELTYDVIARPGLRWTTSANWSKNSNELVTLSDETFQPSNDCRFDGGTGEPIQQSTHRNCVGEPIGNFYGYQSVDIADDGSWIVLNKDGERISIRDATAEDRHVLGNGFPKQFFAWNNTAQWKGFDLSTTMRGAAGFQILNTTRMYYENPAIVQYNMLKSAFDPVYGKRTVDYDLSYVSYYIEDGDYLKLDNVTLGYTFSANQLGRLGSVLTGARLYGSGRNLLTITGYKGLDPEVSTIGLNPGNAQRDAYPTTRMLTFGMTVSF